MQVRCQQWMSLIYRIESVAFDLGTNPYLGKRLNLNNLSFKLLIVHT